MRNAIEFNELKKVIVTKFSSYDKYQCEAAIADCHATFKSLGDAITPDYSEKLWCEIDTARERIEKLNKQK